MLLKICRDDKNMQNLHCRRDVGNQIHRDINNQPYAPKVHKTRYICVKPVALGDFYLTSAAKQELCSYLHNTGTKLACRRYKNSACQALNLCFKQYSS